jgi:hypothetical protein
MKGIKINNWSITLHPAVANNPYLAPELRQPSVHGFAVGHPKLGNSEVITSPIAEVRGRTVVTETGSHYHLGRIAPKYRAWLKANRPEWNWRKPITVKGGE